MTPAIRNHRHPLKGHTMKVHRSTRSCRSLFLVIVTTLLLTTSQLAGTSAQTAQQQMAGSYFDAVQGGGAYSLVGPHAVLHTPEGSFAGTDGPTRFGAKLEESFTNVTFATRNTETVGEYVMIEFTLTGIHTGAYLDVSPECAGVAVPGLAILHVEESGITQQWISYDPGTVISQIDAFGQIDASSRPTCASQGVVQPVSDFVPASLCLDLDSCSYMP